MKIKKGLFEKINCVVCGSDKYKIIIKPNKKVDDPTKIISASGGVMGTQQVVKCPSCGLSYVNPRIISKKVINSYSEADDSLYASQAEGRINTFKESLNFIEKYSPKKGKILDVGAAAGFFLKVAKNSGWTTHGVEPSKWSVNFANKNYKVNVFQGVLKDAKFKDNFFDVVTMWDVLEHVPNPTEELNEIYRVLKPGGLLVINYPDFGTPLAKLAGAKWWFLLSVHLFYFDKSSMTKILSKCGFVNPKFTSYWQSLSLGHLAKMIGLYSKPLSNMCETFFGFLRINNLKVKYYASQTNVIVWKPKNESKK